MSYYILYHILYIIYHISYIIHYILYNIYDILYIMHYIYIYIYIYYIVRDCVKSRLLHTHTHTPLAVHPFLPLSPLSSSHARTRTHTGEANTDANRSGIRRQCGYREGPHAHFYRCRTTQHRRGADSDGQRGGYDTRR